MPEGIIFHRDVFWLHEGEIPVGLVCPAAIHGKNNMEESNDGTDCAMGTPHRRRPYKNGKSRQMPIPANFAKPGTYLTKNSSSFEKIDILVQYYCTLTVCTWYGNTGYG